MALEISDRFYEPYSFAVDFGHGQKQEIENVRDLLINKGLTGTNTQIKDCLEFVKQISPIIRDTCVDEINIINKITKKEKITGGIIPPEILIDYEMLPHKEVRQTDDGRYYLHTEMRPTPISTEFEIIGRDFVRVNTAYAGEIAFSVLSMGLGNRQDYVRTANFDLVRLATDYRGHWLAGVERDGHWQKGILYGDDLARDNILSQEYPRMTKNQVGFTTRFFGDPVKIRVTRDGSVTAMSNVVDADYLQFVLTELREYMVDGDAPRRRRTF